MSAPLGRAATNEAIQIMQFQIHSLKPWLRVTKGPEDIKLISDITESCQGMTFTVTGDTVAAMQMGHESGRPEAMELGAVFISGRDGLALTGGMWQGRAPVEMGFQSAPPGRPGLGRMMTLE